MSKKWLWTGIVALSLLGTARIAHANIVADSAALDKAYIPALALTNQNEPEKSKAAMAKLKDAWRVYAATYRAAKPSDRTWRQGFADIDSWLAQADATVTTGTRLADTLEYVRVTLMQLRQKNGIDYFLDHQTAFHEPMEEIVLTVKGKTPDTLTPKDVEKIRQHIPALTTRWSAVQKAPVNPADFGFDSARSTKMKQLMDQETAAISALLAVLAQPDNATVIQRAAAIKPPFAQLYMLFGGFSP